MQAITPAPIPTVKVIGANGKISLGKQCAGQPSVGGRSSQPIQHQAVHRQRLVAVQEVAGPVHLLVGVGP